MLHREHQISISLLNFHKLECFCFAPVQFHSLSLSVYHRWMFILFHTLFSDFDLSSPFFSWGANANVAGGFSSFFSPCSLTCIFLVHSPVQQQQIWGETARNRGLAHEDGGEIRTDGKGRSAGWWIRLYAAWLTTKGAKGKMFFSDEKRNFKFFVCNPRRVDSKVILNKTHHECFSCEDFLSDSSQRVCTQFIWNSWTTSSCLRWWCSKTESIELKQWARIVYFANIWTVNWNLSHLSLSSLWQAFHTELHTYKHHIELFNQLTQKLIAVYPSDDTSRVKRMSENINLR